MAACLSHRGSAARGVTQPYFVTFSAILQFILHRDKLMRMTREFGESRMQMASHIPLLILQVDTTMQRLCDDGDLKSFNPAYEFNAAGPFATINGSQQATTP